MAESNSHLPYPTETVWKFKALTNQFSKQESLWLDYVIDGAAISDDYRPNEVTAEKLWREWVNALSGEEPVHIDWTVNPVAEGAPWNEEPNFLSYYSAPENAGTGEPIKWSRLPVRDCGWHAGHYDRGGFIQELTGWKPAPYQTMFDYRLMATLSGLWLPSSVERLPYPRPDA